MQKVAFEQFVPLIRNAFSQGQTITISVAGTSMLPLLRPKDAVTLAQPSVGEVVRGDILLYRRPNGRYVLHRVVDVNSDTIDFCGDNQVVIERDVPKACVIAQVISYEKDGKTIPLQQLRREGCKRLQTRAFRIAAKKLHVGRAPKSPVSIRFLLSYVKKRVWSVAFMCLFSCVSALATLGMAFASGRVIDKALGGDLDDFSRWFWFLFALMFLVAGCSILNSNIRVRAVGGFRNDLRQDLVAQLLSKRYTALQSFHTGELMNRLTSDIQIVVDTAISLIPQTASSLIKLLGGLIVLMTLEPVFTSVLLIGAVSIALIVHIFGRLYKSLHKQCQETEGKTRSFLQECLENILVIKSFVNDHAVLAKLNDYQNDNLKKQVRRNAFANIGNTMIYTGFTFAYYAGLAWGVLRIIGVIGTLPMTVGVFAMMLQLLEQIRAPFRSTTGILPQVMAMTASAERLHELMMLPDEDFCTDEAVPFDFDRLELSDVSFCYDDHKAVLKDARASLKRGEFAVLAGLSGTGKTTIIKLLLGLVEPTDGELSLCVGEKRIAVSAATRALFAFVPQGNMLLSGSLRDNVTFGCSEVSDEALERALSLACLSDVVRALPNGVDTVIGERGYGLSEGQLQRVAVARALLCDAPVLLLDECTSALDESTEQRLLDNLCSLTDRTILFISHRPAVLRCADSLWTIRDGGISCKSIKGSES